MGQRDLFQVLEAQGRLALRHGENVYIPAYNGPKYNQTGIELGLNGKETLWNLAEDPSQREDLSEEMPELLDTMRKEFESLTEK